MKLKRVWDVFAKEGIHTFFYLINGKIKQFKSEEKKYDAYIKKCEPYLNQHFINAVKGEVKDNIYELIDIDGIDAVKRIQKSECSYIGLKSSFVKPDKNSEEHICAYLMWLNKKGYDCCFVYTDEDESDEKSGKRCKPKFKPEYSPDTILSYNYIGGFWCAKKELIVEALESVATDGILPDTMLLYEALMLKVLLSLKPSQVYHLKGVYFHRYKAEQYSEQYLNKLSQLKEKLLSEKGISAKVVSAEKGIPVQHVLYESHEQPLVSIIIPSKDNPGLLKQCVDSITKCTAYDNYELVVVDNGSSKEHQQEYKTILGELNKPMTYHYEAMEFNFSKMCNIGADLSNGKYYLFLNDDVEVLPVKEEKYDWISILLGQAMQSHTGAVGAKLLYPNTTLIQHVGVVNYESGASHIFAKEDDTKVLKDYRNRADYNYLCVTAACLLVDAKKYHEVSGFSEKLAVTFNDVEFCMKLHNAGYYQVVRNDVVLYHHESITRGEDAVDEKKFRRHLNELEKIHAMHPDFVKRDNFYSSLLTQSRLDASVNTDYHSVLITHTALYTMDESVKEIPDMYVEIESVLTDETLTVRGYAYLECNYNDCLYPFVVLKGDNATYKAEAKKLYDPNMTKLKDSMYNLNFTQFISVADLSVVEKGVYEMYIGLRKNNHIKAMKKTGMVIEL